MSTLIHARIASARAGTNPTVICRMPSGWAVLSDAQFLRGYSILLADPVVPNLNALDHAQRAQYLLDMTVLGDALLEVTGACRINYEILCNTERALHAHILPRYLTEPEDMQKVPAFFYSPEFRGSIPFNPERDRDLVRQIAQAVRRRLHG